MFQRPVSPLIAPQASLLPAPIFSAAGGLSHAYVPGTAKTSVALVETRACCVCALTRLFSSAVCVLPAGLSPRLMPASPVLTAQRPMSPMAVAVYPAPVSAGIMPVTGLVFPDNKHLAGRQPVIVPPVQDPYVLDDLLMHPHLSHNNVSVSTQKSVPLSMSGRYMPFLVCLPLVVELTSIHRLYHLHQGITPLSYDVALPDFQYVYTLCPAHPSHAPSISVHSPTMPSFIWCRTFPSSLTIPPPHSSDMGTWWPEF